MKAGHLYELYFPYEEGQGGKVRPVLILVITNVNNEAIGLKITNTGPTKKHPYRIKIKDSPNANLSATSHVQYDTYTSYDNIQLPSRGYLSEYDFGRIARKFADYFDL
jgi:hypothetical protein